MQMLKTAKEAKASPPNLLPTVVQKESYPGIIKSGPGATGLPCGNKSLQITEAMTPCLINILTQEIGKKGVKFNLSVKTKLVQVTPDGEAIYILVYVLASPAEQENLSPFFPKKQNISHFRFFEGFEPEVRAVDLEPRYPFEATCTNCKNLFHENTDLKLEIRKLRLLSKNLEKKLEKGYKETRTIECQTNDRGNIRDHEKALPKDSHRLWNSTIWEDDRSIARRIGGKVSLEIQLQEEIDKLRKDLYARDQRIAHLERQIHAWKGESGWKIWERI
ncbi:hypothetical protein CHS0354_041181 [Potamilus streckersoni]|uniref:Uncharacterized protein n=1 Tax=Potamilus streckersoni TaxID=2493646 RepID=A0AAE0VV42_9BIVA|nr:hypothetical protein CHS0354_041181 [Potamilus streckersoni]